MTSIVCIPGVGLGGWAFDAVGVGRVIERPASGSVEEQADTIASDIRGAEGSALVVGVSGGATVGLALVLRHPDVVTGAVLHEPLVGPAVPELHAAILRRAEQPSMAAIVGEHTWQALTDERRASVDFDRVRAEVPAFVQFAVNPADLESLRGRGIVTTVGSRSGPERREVAAFLHARGGVSVVEIPGAANSAHLDAPQAFRQVIDAAALRQPHGGETAAS